MWFLYVLLFLKSALELAIGFGVSAGPPLGIALYSVSTVTSQTTNVSVYDPFMHVFFIAKKDHLLPLKCV